MMKTTKKPRVQKTRRASGKPHRCKYHAKAKAEVEVWRPRGSLERTRALLLAALRVWELKNGFRVIALPGVFLPIPL
jgi:hypothetical protein